MDDRDSTPLDDAPLYADSDERPPWIEEATDPTWWDLAFGSYGDGYLEWVHDRYYWDTEEPRTVADTRALWHHRRRYLSPERLDHLLDEALEQTFPASDPVPLYGGFVDRDPAISSGGRAAQAPGSSHWSRNAANTPSRQGSNTSPERSPA